MPLTFAHPAAAVPLARPMRRWGVLAALIAGSVAPDLVYFLPVRITRAFSHSLTGLFVWCLPAGSALFVLFESVFRRPLRDLMPEAVRVRLDAAPTGWPPFWWIAAPVSVLTGSMTHLLWDAFTHPEAPAVAAFPFLRWRLFTISDYHVCVFSILQHASTVLGILLLVRWTRAWVARTAPRPGPPAFTVVARRAIVAGIMVAASVAALMVARPYFPDDVTIQDLQPFAWHLVCSGVGALGVGVILYTVVWYVRRPGTTR